MKSIVTMIVLGLAASFANAQHADIVARAEAGRIVTSGHIDSSNEDLPGLRVFGFDFGEDPLDPFFAADPGFNSPMGALPPNSQLRFDIPSAATVGLPSNLSYWNGQGDVAFTLPPAGHTLQLNLGSQDRTIGAGVDSMAGFTIGIAGADGSLHRHLNSFLVGAGGADPVAGAYLVSIQLASSDLGLAPSDPLFVLYNNGLSEEAHDAAIEFVQNTIIPEPAGLLFIFSAAILLQRKRCTKS